MDRIFFNRLWYVVMYEIEFAVMQKTCFKVIEFKCQIFLTVPLFNGNILSLDS
jgi:hypothetical protein